MSTTRDELAIRTEGLTLPAPRRQAIGDTDSRSASSPGAAAARAPSIVVTPPEIPEIRADIPDPDTLAAYPPEVVGTILDMAARAFDAQVALQREALETAREHARLELRKIELANQRVDRELKLAERRLETESRDRQTAAKQAAASLEARQAMGLRIGSLGLVCATLVGVFASPWVGGGVALASLGAWLLSQRNAHRANPVADAALATESRELLALPDE